MAGFYEHFFQHPSVKIHFHGETFAHSDLSRHMQAIETVFVKSQVRAGQMLFLKADNHFLHLLLFLLCEKMGLVFVPLFAGQSEFETNEHRAALKPEWICELKDGQVHLQAFASKSILTETQSGCLFQTSGTTGKSGYILQNFENLMQNARHASEGQKISPSSQVLSTLPFSHVGGLCMQTTAALLQGSEIVIEDRYQFSRFLNYFKTVSHTIIVPSYFQLLKDRSDFRELKPNQRPTVVTGSTTVSNSLFQNLTEKNCHVQAVYGLTEIGPYVCIAESLKEIPSQALSQLGTPHPSYRMQIHPETNEILISGPCHGKKINVLTGNLEGLLDDQGFLPTGDLGYYQNGTFYFSGRAKTMIIVGGLKVNPSEIEQKIWEIPSVQKCAVVAKTHSLLGEIPIAYVVGDPRDKIKIQTHLKTHLSKHKIPRQILFVENLPETSIGKNHLALIRKKTQDASDS